MRNNLFSIVFGIVIIGGALLVRGALLPVSYYSVAHAATTATTAAEYAAGQKGAFKSINAAARMDILKSIAYKPENVLKISSGDVIALLQEPEFMRGESLSMQMWQYRTEDCVLDVYLSENGKVTHYEMRARDRGVADAQVQGSCMRDLIAQNRDIQMVDVAAIYKAVSN